MILNKLNIGRLYLSILSNVKYFIANSMNNLSDKQLISSVGDTSNFIAKINRDFKLTEIFP